MAMDKTLTPSPWTTPMDYPNGLPLKWTSLKNTISNEYYWKNCYLYTYIARTLFIFVRTASSHHFE